MAQKRMRSDDFSRRITEARKALSPTQIGKILETTGGMVGAKAESDFKLTHPTPSGKPLPLYYTRTVTATKPYYTIDGQLRLPGAPYKSKFKSMAQQRYVLMLAKRGEIPYKRTNVLMASVHYVVIIVSPTQIAVVLGTNVKYAPYVIDALRQSHYHKGNWTPLQTSVRGNFSAYKKLARKVLLREIERAMQP